MSTGITIWSQTAASNANASTNINYAEGQTPSSLNDSCRSLMSEVKKFVDDITAIQPSNVVQTTGGAANVQTLTSNGSAQSLLNGWTLAFKAGFSNTSSCTLNVDALGAIPVQLTTGSALVGGEIVAGKLYTVTYHQPANAWILHSGGGVNSFSNISVTGGTISGGTITGVSLSSLTSPLAIADGGTAATSAANARTNLGLGTIATQAASAVAITGGTVTGITNLTATGGTLTGITNITATGGTITGITDLAVADGGTGASDAATARTNLGLGTAATQNTGTSGANLPFLNGANTWSADNIFSARIKNGTFSLTGLSDGWESDVTNFFIYSSRATTANVAHHNFYNPNGLVGQITTSGSATAFVTSSDERLKDNFLAPDPLAIGALIDKINIYNFTWRADGSPGLGPKAQELYEVVPAAARVGGDDPKTDPWSWDASKLVPHMLVEIKSLRRRVAELEAKG